MASAEQTTSYLVPRMGDLPVSSSRHYQTATITGVLGQSGPTSPIEAALALPAPASVKAGRPAVGVLLTHQQQWILAGTALGPLVHSVCLAPGEITQIAVNHQSRRVADDSVERGLQRDDVASSGTSSSDVAESERARASQVGAGGSMLGSASSTTEAGASSLLGLSAGGGTTLSSASQASVSTGTKAVSDEANQRVHQAARDQAQSARARTTAAVREVSESDALEIDTRVIVNYNHMHALTMEYFEVEQVYQLRTSVTDAERLVFVPMRVIDFSDPVAAAAAISRYRNELIAVAGDLGLHHVVAKLASERLNVDPAPPAPTVPPPVLAAPTGLRLDGTPPPGTSSAGAAPPPVVDPLVKREQELAAESTAAVTELEAARTERDAASDAVAKARDDLRAVREGSLLARTQAQRALEVASARDRAAQDGLIAAQAAVDAVQEVLRGARWDIEQRRLAADLDDEDVRELLDAHRLAVNQGLWLRLDPSTTAGFLARRAYDGDPLGDSVDPTPVAVSGHLLGFRWRFRDPAEEAAFVAEHTSESTLEHSVSVPTGGLFGEAVLGTSTGAERIDLTRFWNWKDSLPPLRPTPIAPVAAAPPETLAAASPGRVAESQLPMGPISFPQVAPTLPAVAGLLANPDLFRDMSSSATTAALATSAMELSATGAAGAATLASENYRRFLQFQHAVASTVLEAVQRPAVDATLAGGALNAKRGEGGATTAGGDDDGEALPAAESGAGGQTGGATSGSATHGGAPGGGTTSAGEKAGSEKAGEKTPGGQGTFEVDFEGDTP